MLTPEEKEKLLQEWRQKLMTAVGRDPLEVMEMRINDDGQLEMRGKPIAIPLINILKSQEP